MKEIIFIMVATWIGFDAELHDIPVQYFGPKWTYNTRDECEKDMQRLWAGEQNYRLETIKTARDEIVLRVRSGTRSYNTFITCMEVELDTWRWN